MNKLKIIWETINILRSSKFTGKAVFEVIFNKGGIRAVKKYKLADL